MSSSETAAVIDGASPMTRVGRYNLDPSRLGFGYGVNGAMTQYVRVPARCLHRVPDNLPFEQACLTEPCAVAFNAVIENTRLKPADRVVVLGPGPIGILCAALARLSAMPASGRAPGMVSARTSSWTPQASARRSPSRSTWCVRPVGSQK